MSIERRRTKRLALSLESMEGRVVLSTSSYVAGAAVPAALVSNTFNMSFHSDPNRF